MMNRIVLILVMAINLNPVLILAQQAHLNVDWKPFENTENLAPPYGTNTVSPIVHNDRTVTFKLLAPDVNSVFIVGIPSDTGGPIRMDKSADGLWEATTGPLDPDIYNYKLRIDDVNVPDPNNSIVGFANQPPYSKLIVHGDSPAYYDPKDVPHGAVTRHIYYSEVTDGEREMYVYTPPG